VQYKCLSYSYSYSYQEIAHGADIMNVERHQVTADPQTKSADLGCDSAYKLLSSAPSVRVQLPVRDIYLSM